MKKSAVRWLWSLGIVFLAIIVLAGAFFGAIFYKRSQGTKQNYDDLLGSANKVVLFIGDGMGENHIKTAQAYLERDIFFTNFEISGHCTTHSNAVLSPTDSAAAASALATGKKFDNSEVSRHGGVDVKTISELAITKGFGVGIVTTDSLDGATPASFSSHANKRGDSDEIIKGQINSNIKLFLGAGKNTYEAYKNDFVNHGYTYKNDYSSLDKNANKLLGTFEKVEASDGTDLAPNLEMLSNFAIDYMEQNCPQGYFLMIEGAHIDKRSHKNDIMSMIQYLDNFDASIKSVYDKIGSQENTAIVVTADHETGGLKYNNETKDQISNKMYTRTGHSSANVPYYVHIKNSSVQNASKIFAKTIDNTDIFRLCKSCLNV